MSRKLPPSQSNNPDDYVNRTEREQPTSNTVEGDFGENPLTRITREREEWQQYQRSNEESASRHNEKHIKTVARERMVLTNPDLNAEALRIAELRYPIPEGANAGLVQAFRKSHKKVAQEYLKRTLSGEALPVDNTESGEPSYAKSKRLLAEIGESETQGMLDREQVYRDQDKLILDSEKVDAEKWKQYITDQNQLRLWREGLRLPFLPKWGKWGELELAVFDWFNGDRIKNLSKFGTAEKLMQSINMELQQEHNRYAKEVRESATVEDRSLITTAVYRPETRKDVAGVYKVIFTTPESSTVINLQTAQVDQWFTSGKNVVALDGGELGKKIDEAISRYNEKLIATGNEGLSMGMLESRKKRVLKEVGQQILDAMRAQLKRKMKMKEGEEIKNNVIEMPSASTAQDKPQSILTIDALRSRTDVGPHEYAWMETNMVGQSIKESPVENTPVIEQPPVAEETHAPAKEAPAEEVEEEEEEEEEEDDDVVNF